MNSLPCVLSRQGRSAIICAERRKLSVGILRKSLPKNPTSGAQLLFLSRGFQTTSINKSIAPQTASIPPMSKVIPQETIECIQPPPDLVEDTLQHSVDVLASAFQNDPFMRYFQFDEAAGPQTENLSYDYLKPIMADIVESFIADEGATLITLPGVDLTTAWYFYSCFSQ